METFEKTIFTEQQSGVWKKIIFPHVSIFMHSSPISYLMSSEVPEDSGSHEICRDGQRIRFIYIDEIRVGIIKAFSSISAQ